MHLRHRLVRARQHRDLAGALRRRTAHDGRVDGSRPHADLRAGGRDLRHRVGRAVAARRAAASSAPRPRPSRSPARCRTAAAWCSCPHSPGSAHRTGTRPRAARSSASPAAPRGRTSCAPPWRRSRSRCATWSSCCRASRRCASTAAPRPTTCSCSCRPTPWRCRSSGRRCSRRPGSAPRSSPGSAPACGRRPTSSPRPGALDRRFEPSAGVDPDAREAAYRRWRAAVDRAKGWADL